MTSSLTVSYYSEKGGLSLCIIKNLKVPRHKMNEHKLPYIFETTVGLLVYLNGIKSYVIQGIQNSFKKYLEAYVTLNLNTTPFVDQKVYQMHIWANAQCQNLFASLWLNNV